MTYATYERVQIHPDTDLWARGMRYGTIMRPIRGVHGKTLYRLLVDETGLTYTVNESTICKLKPEGVQK